MPIVYTVYIYYIQHSTVVKKKLTWIAEYMIIESIGKNADRGAHEENK
jgi:hypothetical protein